MSNLISVSCGLILKDNKLLCAQRNEKMSHPLKWEFPGGKLEKDESPENSLIRELKEELNLIIQIKESLGHFQYRYHDELEVKLFPFVCRIVGGEMQLNEHKCVEWVSINSLEKLDWVAADIPIMLKFKTLYLNLKACDW